MKSFFLLSQIVRHCLVRQFPSDRECEGKIRNHKDIFCLEKKNGNQFHVFVCRRLVSSGVVRDMRAVVICGEDFR